MRVAILTGPTSLPVGTLDACQRWAETSAVEISFHRAGRADALAALILEVSEDSDAVLLNSGRTRGSAVLEAAVRSASVPVVHVDTAESPTGPAPVAVACRRRFHGRGRSSYKWALKHVALVWRAGLGTRHNYGDHEDQYVEVRCPNRTAGGRLPTAVLLHGGFWRRPWQLDLMDEVAVDLVARGWCTVNVEYRRGSRCWPRPATDAAAAMEHLSELQDEHPIDFPGFVVIGHSAGAQVGVAAISRLTERNLPSPPALVSLAGLLDLRFAAAHGLGDRAVAEAFGHLRGLEPTYATASPSELVPLGIKWLVVHGARDDLVPTEASSAFVAKASAADDDVGTLFIADAGHFDLIDPASHAWHQVAARLPGQDLRCTHG